MFTPGKEVLPLVEPCFDELESSADVDEAVPVSQLQQLMRQFAQFAPIQSPADLAITGEDHRLIGRLPVFELLRFSTGREVRLPCSITSIIFMPPPV